MPTLSRVLLRVVAASVSLKMVRVVIPTWSPNQEILLSIKNFPEEYHTRLYKDMRFLAEVNLDAQVVGDLVIENIEPVANTPEYQSLISARHTLLAVLPFIQPEVSPEAFSRGITQQALNTLELICQTIGEPVPLGLDS